MDRYPKESLASARPTWHCEVVAKWSRMKWVEMVAKRSRSGSEAVAKWSRSGREVVAGGREVVAKWSRSGRESFRVGEAATIVDTKSQTNRRAQPSMQHFTHTRPIG